MADSNALEELSPEFRLLCATSWIAPQQLAPNRRETVSRLLAGGMDWQRYLSLVKWHRVWALAHATLALHPGEVPREVLEELKVRSRNSRTQALQLTAELVRVLRLFAEAGIEVLPLKGQLLSLYLYDDLGMRHAKDLDLLVKQEDLERAAELVEGEGYRCDFPYLTLSARSRAFILGESSNLEYQHPQTGVQIELHWRSEYWTAPQTATLWRHCEPLTRQGITANWLRDDILLLFLCGHGATHQWVRLKWLSDVAVLLAQKGFEDGKVVDLAEELDLARPLAQGALLAHALYGVPLSDPLRRLVAQEKKSAALARHAAQQLQRTEQEPQVLEKLLDRRFYGIGNLPYHMALRKRTPYRSFLKSMLINYDDVRKFPLPAPLFWLYGPLRPVFWLLRRTRGE